MRSVLGTWCMTKSPLSAHHDFDSRKIRNGDVCVLCCNSAISITLPKSWHDQNFWLTRWTLIVLAICMYNMTYFNFKRPITF